MNFAEMQIDKTESPICTHYIWPSAISKWFTKLFTRATIFWGT